MKKLIAVAACAGLLTVVACEKKNTPPANPAPKTTGTAPTTKGAAPVLPKVDTSTIGQKTSEAMGDAKDKMVTAFESGMTSAKTKLDEWGAKVNAAAADKKPEMQAALDKMKASYSQLTTDLGALKNKAGAEWDKAWADLKASWGNLETSMKDFTAKYNP